MTFVNYAQPPISMTTPETLEGVITAVLSVLVAAVVMTTLVYWRRTGDASAFLLTLGGTLCSFNEPLVDTIGHVYFPENGRMAWEFFGRGVPVWVVLSYTLFFGTAAFVNVLVMRSGIRRSTLWKGLLVFWVANLALEIPILLGDVYIYYGDQPFAVGGFPLAWLTINSLGDFLAAVVVMWLLPHLAGARKLLLVLIPFVTYAASWSLSMPYFLALNSEAGALVEHAAAVVAIVTVLIAMDVLIRFGLAKDRSQTISTSASSPTDA